VLAEFAAMAERQSKKIALNRWVLPVTPSITTATFGEYGLWASYHTGLDFNGSEGQSFVSIANGVVTSVGYDGSYGNKTVVTLEDGTEIWYCHQSSFGVSEGEEVRAGEVIGYIGSTGNVTGSHLHIEVRPGGGDPVDPHAAFVVHGVTP
jgi:murein DD-endopeptidase MepM/ murein hydrolase activator NlpD